MIKILLEQNCKIQILDHHITAKERMENLSFAIFDMNKSGTGLTWEYFYPHTPIPYFLAMLQDQDLWKFELPHTKEFTNGFIFKCQSEENLEDRFKLMDELINNPETIKEYIDLGSKIQTLSRGKDEIDELFKKILEKAVPTYRANNNWIRDKGEEEERIEDKITELRRSMITLFDELEGIHKKMKKTKRQLNSDVRIGCVLESKTPT
jgi:oligoribonuclease NrnB/cAMP/cGMP phosphodiesterase (DHH superfamily)